MKADRPWVVLVTSSYPLGAGEQFLTDELPHWSASAARLTILPEKHAAGERRPVPAGIEVRTSLADRWNDRRAEASVTARAMLSPLLRRELVALGSGRRLSPYRVKHALLSVARVEMVLDEIRRLVRAEGRPVDVWYAYWMSVSAFAGVLAKREGLVRHVVARAHGTDLYEAARPERYTALVRQLAAGFDLLCPVSDDGAAEAARYGFAPAQVRTARLGVQPAGTPCSPSPAGELHLYSVSALKPLKQVPVIARAVAEVARRLPDTRVRWTHAGAGEQEPEVRQVIAGELAPAGVTATLLGHLSHADVLAHYAEQPVDLLLNASTTEGVPVSIMEAMARGVPAIAPAVGAVAELVPTELLLQPPAAPGPLADRIVAVADAAKTPELRTRMVSLQRERYDAARNHGGFVADLVELGRA